MPKPPEPMRIDHPLILVFHPPGSGDLVTHIYPPPGYGPAHYGIMICDVVRHIANALRCDPDEIWDMIEQERANPTSEIRRVS